MEQEQLRKAFGLMKQGQTKEALAIVQAVLKEDKNNVPAWWLMTSLLADDPERQRKALEKVLTLDPKHKLALQLKAKLDGGSTPKPSAKPQQQQAQPQAKSTEEINFDWGKLDAQESKKKQSDEDASNKTVQIATYGMIAFVLILAVIIGAMWAIPAYQFAQINNPETATLRFYSSVLQGDFPTARTLVCPDMQAAFDERVREFRDIINSIKSGFGEGAVLVYDLSGLNAAELSNDGTNAHVQVTGSYSISAPNISEDVFENEIVASEETVDELRNENGIWCVAKIQ